jgi:hypothetical protein
MLLHSEESGAERFFCRLSRPSDSEAELSKCFAPGAVVFMLEIQLPKKSFD